MWPWFRVTRDNNGGRIFVGVLSVELFSNALTRYFQVEEGELKKKAVTDSRAAVAVDVGLLRQIPGLPEERLVSGLIYNVATGLVEIVVPPTRIGTA